MAEFLLVHGAFHGAWCWREIAPRLEKLGHSAAAVDLPAHGEDRTPIEAVSLDDYVAAVLRAREHLRRPPILVGHSLGGVVIQAAAEAHPDAFSAIVGLAACHPPDGMPVAAIMHMADPECLAQFVWSPDRTVVRILPDGLRKFLYQLCPADVVEEAVSLAAPESAALFETPLRTSAARFGRLPRYYIGCRQDRVIPQAARQLFSEGLPAGCVYNIEADHMPLFSAPGEVAACLDAIAREVTAPDQGRSQAGVA